MKTRLAVRAAVAAAGLVLLPLSAGCAQGRSGIGARVDAAPDGEVWMHFTSRPGVCGWENGISTRDGGGERQVRTGDGRWRQEECEEGPVYVALVRRGGRLTDVRTRVARGWSREGRRVTDLGRVPAAEAADYLLRLAEREGASEGEDAVFPATIADSANVSPALLRIARNERTAEKVRKSAVFWLSQAAGDAATRGLQEVVDEDGNQEVREHAVFALSQRPRDESVPALIRIARTHRDPKIRRTALFWLGQSNDPRAVALFEELLTRP